MPACNTKLQHAYPSFCTQLHHSSSLACMGDKRKEIIAHIHTLQIRWFRDEILVRELGDADSFQICHYYIHSHE